MMIPMHLSVHIQGGRGVFVHHDVSRKVPICSRAEVNAITKRCLCVHITGLFCLQYRVGWYKEYRGILPFFMFAQKSFGANN